MHTCLHDPPLKTEHCQSYQKLKFSNHDYDDEACAWTIHHWISSERSESTFPDRQWVLHVHAPNIHVPCHRCQTKKFCDSIGLLLTFTQFWPDIMWFISPFEIYKVIQQPNSQTHLTQNGTLSPSPLPKSKSHPLPTPRHPLLHLPPSLSLSIFTRWYYPCYFKHWSSHHPDTHTSLCSGSTHWSGFLMSALLECICLYATIPYCLRLQFDATQYMQ